MNSNLRDQLRSIALDEVYWARKASIIVEKKWPDLYKFASEIIGKDRPIVYLEFGVAHGDSMSRMVSLFTNRESRFFGFDSFTGLPEDWLVHKKGAFDNKGVPPKIDDSRVRFVKGWFQNSVPSIMDRLNISPTHEVLVHFDADLYSSTLFLLSLLW